MDCYKEMYFKLFNKMLDIITEIQDVQQETEEMFLLQEETKSSQNSRIDNCLNT